jgi:hypothetical protein
LGYRHIGPQGACASEWWGCAGAIEEIHIWRRAASWQNRTARKPLDTASPQQRRHHRLRKEKKSLDDDRIHGAHADPVRICEICGNELSPIESEIPSGAASRAARSMRSWLGSSAKSLRKAL